MMNLLGHSTDAAERTVPRESTPVSTTFVLLRRWQTFLEVSGEANDNTRRQYRRAIVAFLADELIELEEVTEDLVIGYMARMSERSGMRGMVLRALKSFYRWAVPRGILEHDPTARLKIRRSKAGPVRALEPSDLERVLTAAESIDPRARPTIALAYATGARVGSLCALLPEDVRGGRVVFRNTKGDRPYEVPIGSRAQEAIDQLLELMNWTPKGVTKRSPTLVGVGPSRVWQWVHAAGEAVGVDASPHSLRRTYGTALASNPDVDLRTWVELMGHSDGSQLRRYAKASDPRLRRAVEAL